MKATLEFTLIFILSLFISDAVFGQTYATLPFTESFGSGGTSLGSNWSTATVDASGRIESRNMLGAWPAISADNTSLGTLSGNGLLFYNTTDLSAANYLSAFLYLNLNGGTGVTAQFNVTDWGTQGTDDYRDVLNVYISTNGGTSFGATPTLVDLGASPYSDGTTNPVAIDINALATANSLSLSATTVLKFEVKLRRKAVLTSMRGGATNTRQYVYIDNFSVTGTTTLPVELNYFTGLKIEDKILLSWQTLSEINNNFFAVERSSDGINFEKIGEVQGQGSSNIINDYSFIDENPSPGINYYRLQQIDNDGSSSHSAIASLDFGGTQNLSVYPNPSNGIFNIQFEQDFTGTIVIYNAIGKMVYLREVNEKLPIVSISANELARGNYLLQVINKKSSSQNIVNTKIIITN